MKSSRRTPPIPDGAKPDLSDLQAGALCSPVLEIFVNPTESYNVRQNQRYKQDQQDDQETIVQRPAQARAAHEARGPQGCYYSNLVYPLRLTQFVASLGAILNQLMSMAFPPTLQ